LQEIGHDLCDLIWISKNSIRTIGELGYTRIVFESN